MPEKELLAGRNNGTPDMFDTPILDFLANAANNVYWMEQGLVIRRSTTSNWKLVYAVGFLQDSFALPGI